MCWKRPDAKDHSETSSVAVQDEAHVNRWRVAVGPEPRSEAALARSVYRASVDWILEKQCRNDAEMANLHCEV
jgi:hypothetical protein